MQRSIQTSATLWLGGATAIALLVLVLRAQVRQRQRQGNEDRNQRPQDDEWRLDEELDASFPASDPPSHSSPTSAQAGGPVPER